LVEQSRFRRSLSVAPQPNDHPIGNRLQEGIMNAKKRQTRCLAGRDDLVAWRDRLIADYEWLRRMATVLEMETDQIDQRIIELERLLPDDYHYPGDPEGA
jgi:hypothetical protein